jgi:hypothetical protein
MSVYSDFVDQVRAWSNRDSDVLSDTVIQDAMRFAADKAYKALKVPALESIATYEVIGSTAVARNIYEVYIDSTQNYKSVVKLPIPADLSTFISLRIKDSSNDSKKGVVFNEKADVRTFFDMYSDRYSDFVWSRQLNFILASGDITEGDVIELYYYRRLPALDAQYAVTADNFNAGVINVATIQAASGTSLYFANGTSYPPVPFTDTAYATQNTAGDRVQFYFDPLSGQYLDNWLRDDNEQVILFGALEQCFDYLDDSVQSQRYKAKYIEAIEELNREEKLRKTSGGNTQIHFNSQLI